MKKRIVIYNSEDVKELVNIAGKSGFTVHVGTGSNWRNASSMLGMFTVDFSKPFDIVYEGTDEALDRFVEIHAAE